MAKCRVPKDEQKPLSEIHEDSVDCLLCGGHKTVLTETVLVREQDTEDDTMMVETSETSFLCLRCGFKTNTKMVIGSDYVEEGKTHSPRLVVDLATADNTRNLVWIPNVINLEPKAVLYPDGTLQEWQWAVAPWAELSEQEAAALFYTDEERERFKYRLAVEKAVKFERYDFQNALAYLGALALRNSNG